MTSTQVEILLGYLTILEIQNLELLSTQVEILLGYLTQLTANGTRSSTQVEILLGYLTPIL